MYRQIEEHLRTKWLGHLWKYYPETDSTNERAKASGEHGMLFWANVQTAGKGRRGRVWESPEEKNIYMSIYLKPDIAIGQAPMLTLVMAYSVAKVLRDTYGIDAGIKWPNDLVLNKKKICGILTEMSVSQGTIDYVVIGTGINVGNQEFPEGLQKSATSLWLETGKKYSRAAIIAEVLNVFEEAYERFCKVGDLSMIQKEYNEILANNGQEVKVLDEKGHFTGTAVGINERGELLVKKEDGTMEHVFAGEVSVRGIYGYV